MITFSFNGIESTNPEFGIIAVRVSRPLLSGMENRLLKITGSNGIYDFGRDLNEIYINVGLTFEGDTIEKKRQAVRKMARWLNTDDVKPLIFSDEPDKQYMARVASEITLNEIGYLADCNVQFVVPDGYAESVTVKNTSAIDNNNGTLETPCIITVIADTGNELKIEYQNTGEFIRIEYDFDGGEEVIVDTNLQKVEIDEVNAIGEVDIDSTFFTLLPDDFTISATNGTITNVKFRERFI